jgi:SAM-dependent methyltransferase
MSLVERLRRVARLSGGDGKAKAGGPARAGADLKGPYVSHVDNLKTLMPEGAAMEEAVGGDFAYMGAIQSGILRHYGLPSDGYLVDVGCGSGRLAKPVSEYLKGRYLGIDLVPDLVAHAKKLVGRPDWRFEVIEHIEIPEADGMADMVCFFSVLTHLLHEQGYWYLEEAKRVLKPGGRIVFSFLEFTEPAHWPVFVDTLQGTKGRQIFPLNMFIDRDALPVWAQHLGLELIDIRSSSDVIAQGGNLGQALCVMQKPVSVEAAEVGEAD